MFSTYVSLNATKYHWTIANRFGWKCIRFNIVKKKNHTPNSMISIVFHFPHTHTLSSAGVHCAMTDSRMSSLCCCFHFPPVTLSSYLKTLEQQRHLFGLNWAVRNFHAIYIRTNHTKWKEKCKAVSIMPINVELLLFFGWSAENALNLIVQKAWQCHMYTAFSFIHLNI